MSNLSCEYIRIEIKKQVVTQLCCMISFKFGIFRPYLGKDFKLYSHIYSRLSKSRIRRLWVNFIEAKPHRI